MAAVVAAGSNGLATIIEVYTINGARLMKLASEQRTVAHGNPART